MPSGAVPSLRCWCGEIAPRHFMLGPCANPVEGAGVVCLRESLCGSNETPILYVMVVSGRSEALGFPKGGRKGKESGKAAAMREWHEETGLDPACLVFRDVVLVDRYGCHYFLAEWPTPLADHDVRGWRPAAEDPADPDPVQSAEWLPLQELLGCTNLSSARKLLLKRAAKLFVDVPGPTSGTSSGPSHVRPRSHSRRHTERNWER